MALADRFAVRHGREALGGVRADRFEHPQPGAPVASWRRTSRLLATSRSSVSMSAPVIVSAASHGGAAGEHREARETRLLVVAEQAVAPVDRRAQRLLAGGRVARPCAESVERALAGVWRSLRGRAARSVRPRARSPAAARRRVGRSPRPRSALSSLELEVGVVRSRALAEQRDGVHVGDRVAGPVPRSGSASGGTG